MDIDLSALTALPSASANSCLPPNAHACSLNDFAGLLLPTSDENAALKKGDMSPSDIPILEEDNQQDASDLERLPATLLISASLPTVNLMSGFNFAVQPEIATDSGKDLPRVGAELPPRVFVASPIVDETGLVAVQDRIPVLRGAEKQAEGALVSIISAGTTKSSEVRNQEKIGRMGARFNQSLTNFPSLGKNRTNDASVLLATLPGKTTKLEMPDATTIELTSSTEALVTARTPAKTVELALRANGAALLPGEVEQVQQSAVTQATGKVLANAIHMHAHVDSATNLKLANAGQPSSPLADGDVAPTAKQFAVVEGLIDFETESSLLSSADPVVHRAKRIFLTQEGQRMPDAGGSEDRGTPLKSVAAKISTGQNRLPAEGLDNTGRVSPDFSEEQRAALAPENASRPIPAQFETKSQPLDDQAGDPEVRSTEPPKEKAGSALIAKAQVQASETPHTPASGRQSVVETKPLPFADEDGIRSGGSNPAAITQDFNSIPQGGHGLVTSHAAQAGHATNKADLARQIAEISMALSDAPVAGKASAVLKMDHELFGPVEIQLARSAHSVLDVAIASNSPELRHALEGSVEKTSHKGQNSSETASTSTQQRDAAGSGHSETTYAGGRNNEPRSKLTHHLPTQGTKRDQDDGANHAPLTRRRGIFA